MTCRRRTSLGNCCRVVVVVVVVVAVAGKQDGAWQMGAQLVGRDRGVVAWGPIKT